MWHSRTICALIQVRMSSTRLPNKALHEIGGVPAIVRVVESLHRSEYIDKIVLTTTRDPSDDALEMLAKQRGLLFYRGDCENVVKRYFEAGLQFGADVIVRATGDCPVVSSELADLLIRSHLENKADYTATETDKVSVGVFSEVISSSALKSLHERSFDFNYSEYMTYYFKNNPDLFRINIMTAPPEYCFPQYRLTLDHEEDLKMFNRLFQKMEQERLSYNHSNLIKILQKYPEISDLNSHLTLKYKTNIELMEKIRTATTLCKP